MHTTEFSPLDLNRQVQRARKPDTLQVEDHLDVQEQPSHLKMELSRKLWHDVALRKEVVPSTGPQKIVDEPPPPTKAFLEKSFSEWMTVMVAPDLRKELKLASVAKKFKIAQEHEADILVALNTSLRTDYDDQHWGSESLHDQTSIAVRAFRALLSNQPAWLAHADRLLVSKGKTWSEFLDTEEGRTCLATINRCMGLTKFPVQAIRDQLAVRQLVVKDQTIYQKEEVRAPLNPGPPVRKPIKTADKDGWMDFAATEPVKEADDQGETDTWSYKGDSLHHKKDERQALSENDLAHAEGVEVGRFHQEAFAFVEERVHLLERVSRDLRQVSARVGDVPEAVTWRAQVQELAVRIGEVQARIGNIQAESGRHLHEADQNKADKSSSSLKEELRNSLIRMHALRDLGTIVTNLELTGMALDKHWSLSRILKNADQMAEQLKRKPFKTTPAELYGN